MKSCLKRRAALAALIGLWGCSDPPATPPVGGDADTGVAMEAAVPDDRGMSAETAVPDVPNDQGSVPVDAGVDVVDVMTPRDDGAPIDTGVDTGVDAGMDVVVPPPDVVMGEDRPVVPDVVDAGVLLPITLTGNFVGAAVSSTELGISLTGQMSWNTTVSASSGGITLEGVLR